MALLRRSRPIKLIGANSEELKMDNRFEEMSLIISAKLGIDAKSMTVLEYYKAYEYAKKINGR